MLRGRVSIPVSTVAPVVVSPEIDSNTACENVMRGVVGNQKGSAPATPSTVQNRATTRKPSRILRSARLRRTGIHTTQPIASVVTKPSMNASSAESP